MARDFLTLADLLGLHTVLIRRYGGAAGVRDAGALEAALFRPQLGYYKDVVSEAAALMESLAINHPFLDGSKQITFAATDVFLRINGWRLKRDPMHIYSEIINMVDTGTFNLARIEPWLRSMAVQQND